MLSWIQLLGVAVGVLVFIAGILKRHDREGRSLLLAGLAAVVFNMVLVLRGADSLWGMVIALLAAATGVFASRLKTGNNSTNKSPSA